MAMINCAECSKEFSDRAESCPNCGCPMINKNERVAEKNIVTISDNIKCDRCGKKFQITYEKDKINKKDIICPKCGKSAGSKAFRIITSIIRITGVVGFVLLALVTIVLLLAPRESSSGDITLREFNRIQNGMTYSEVRNIIGSEGVMLSEVDIGIGNSYVTRIYMWEGNGFGGSNANVTFQGGRVVVKAQIGLR